MTGYDLLPQLQHEIGTGKSSYTCLMSGQLTDVSVITSSGNDLVLGCEMVGSPRVRGGLAWCGSRQDAIAPSKGFHSYVISCIYFKFA